MGRKRGRKVVPGGSVRVRRPDAARLAKPKVKFLSRDKGRSLLRDPLDGRTAVAKAHRTRVINYTAHLGGEVTVTEARLVELAARRSLRTDALWATAAREGLGKPTEAGRDFDRAAEAEAKMLLALGLPRRARELTLSDLLAQDPASTAADGEPEA